MSAQKSRRFDVSTTYVPDSADEYRADSMPSLESSYMSASSPRPDLSIPVSVADSRSAAGEAFLQIVKVLWTCPSCSRSCQDSDRVTVPAEHQSSRKKKDRMLGITHFVSDERLYTS